MIPRRGWEKWRRGGTSQPRRKAISGGRERREERREKWSDGGGERRRERTIEEEERDRKGDCAGVKRRGIDRDGKGKREGSRGRTKCRLGTNREKSRWDLNFAWICISPLCLATPPLYSRTYRVYFVPAPASLCCKLDNYNCYSKLEDASIRSYSQRLFILQQCERTRLSAIHDRDSPFEKIIPHLISGLYLKKTTVRASI